MDPLADECRAAITRSLTTTNCHVLLQNARADPDSFSDVHAECVDFLASQFSAAVSSPTFLKMDVETLRELLGSDMLDMEESSVFEAVCRWLQHSGLGVEDRLCHAGSFLGLIRWSCMPAKYLQQSVVGHAAFAGLEPELNTQVMHASLYLHLPMNH